MSGSRGRDCFVMMGKGGWLPDSLRTWDSGLLGLREEGLGAWTPGSRGAGPPILGSLISNP